MKEKDKQEEEGREGGSCGIFCSSAVNTYLHCHNNVNTKDGFK